MLVISTLRGNSSTARSGWAAADAANKYRFLLAEWLHVDEHAHKVTRISGSLIPIGTCRSLGQASQTVGCLRPIRSTQHL